MQEIHKKSGDNHPENGHLFHYRHFYYRISVLLSDRLLLIYVLTVSIR